MGRNPGCTIYIGNLDEKVTERVLYELLIQVGRVVDLHMPRDKETNGHKGYAFAEYETEEIATYAVKLFSGLVRLHNKTVKFGMSGQDKPSQNSGTPLTPKTISSLPKPYPVHGHVKEVPQGTAQTLVNCRTSAGNHSISPVYPQASSGMLGNRGLSNGTFEYSRRVLGSMINDVSRPGSRNPIVYPSY